MSEEMNVVEDAIEEPVVGEDEVLEDEALETEEPTDDMPSEDEDAEEEAPDINKQFLEQFEIQFDKSPKKFSTIEELKEAAEMGSALPRYKEKLSNYETNPLYNYMDKYMKDSGYDDPAKFVRDIQVNAKASELVNEGLSEEQAQKIANEMVPQPNVDNKSKDISDFITWHDSKVKSGIFNESLDPDSIPEEVLKAYENGESLKEAYQDHLLKDIKFKTEQETLKKVATNKEKSAGQLPETKPDNKQNMTVAQINKIINGMSHKEADKWADDNWDMLERSGYFK